MGRTPVLRERRELGQDHRPTAISVNNEIAAEQVHLWNRYWEATPPQIAVPVASDLSKFILNPNLSLMPFLTTLQDVATSYWSTAK